MSPLISPYTLLTLGKALRNFTSVLYFDSHCFREENADESYLTSLVDLLNSFQNFSNVFPKSHLNLFEDLLTSFFNTLF